MSNFFHDTISRFQTSHHRARRYTAMLLVLALLTSISVSWRLHYVGTALTTDEEPHCGKEEHVHTDACYEKVLVCGHEEGELIYPDADSEAEADSGPAEPKYVKHVHTDACYQDVEVPEQVEEKELTCGLEEHHHTDLCPVDPDTGEYLCGYEEHTHTDACYTTVTKTVTKTERQLVCGYEEGQEVPVDPADEPASEPAESVTPEVHHHTEACYEKKLVCTIPEHAHTAECYADWSADVEDESKWEHFTAPAQDDWNTALLSVAQGQLGYTESEKNFTVDEALGETIGVHHYTRYGAFYNNPYGDWDVMFVSFCQHYAGIPVSVIPQRAGLLALRSDMESMNFAYLTEGEDAPYVAIPGDIVTYYNTDGEETIGIVEDCGDDSLTVISGAVNGEVARVDVLFTDITSTIRVDDAYAAYVGEEQDKPADDSAQDEEHLSFNPDAVLEREGAVAYIMTASGRSFDAYDSDTAAAPQLNYNADGSLKLDDLLNSEAISVNKKINGIDTWVPLDDQTTIDDQTSVRVEIKYAIPSNAFKSGIYKATYTLPEGVYPTGNLTGNITDASENPIGKFYLVKGDPTVHFDFDNPSTGFIGSFKFETKVSYDETGGTGIIQLGNHTFTIKPDYSLDAKKESKLSADRQTISYTVTVKAPYGTKGETVTITDAFDLANSTAKGRYLQDTLKINGKSLSEYPGASIAYTADGDGFTITGLPALHYADPVYTLTYDVAIDSVSGKDGSGTFTNSVTAASGSLTHTDKESVTVQESSLSKAGVYNSSTHRITWTITVKNPGENLEGYKLTDLPVTALDLIGDVTVKDSKGNVISTISGSTFLSSGYIFPPNSTDSSYTFTYTTTAPDPVNGKVYAENKASLEKGEFTYTTTGVSSTTLGKWGLKKEFSSISPLEDGNQKITWNISGTVQAGVTNFRLVDYIRNHAYDSKYGDLYGIPSEIEATVKANLQLTMEGGTTLTWAEAEQQGIQMAFTFYTDLSGKNKATSDSDHIQRFDLSFTCAAGTAKLGILGFSITDIPTVAVTSGMESNATLTFNNRAETYLGNTWQQGYEANYTYKNTQTGSIEKKVSDNVNSISSSSGSTSYAKNKVIWYQITLNLGDTADYSAKTITDHIPDGMKLATGSFNNFQIGVDTDKNEKNKFTTSNNRLVSTGTNQYAFTFGTYTYFSIDASDPDTLIFKIFPNGQKPQYLNFADSSSNHFITLRYALQLDDPDFWNDRDHTVKEYINTAEWNGPPQSATMTVKRPDKPTLTKSGSYDSSTHQANYTLIINPKAENLSSNDTLELTDTMSSSYFGGKGMELLLDSVKVYEYVLRDGDWVQGDEVINGCQVQSIEQTDSTRKYKFILPDEKALVLKYSYKLNTGELAGDITVSNTAELAGKPYSSNPVKIVKDSASATTDNAVLTVTKTDSSTNLAITTSPATFELFHYNKDNGWEPLGSKTTGTNGSFDLTFANSIPELLEIGDLYKLVETAAPANYKPDDTPHYFIWNASAKDDATKLDALQTATGDSSCLGLSVGDVSFFGINGTLTTKRGTLAIPNEQNVLTIRKLWYSLKNDSIDAPVDSVRVQLYRCPEGSGQQTPAPYGEPIMLTKKDGWTKTLTLESGYRYFVKELDTETGELAFFEVKYSQNNDTGVTGGGTITITNKQRPSYELPSTGGSGTAPYWAVGGLLMGAAAVLLARKRRKAE